MEDAVPKNKFPSKPFLPQKNKDKKPFQKEWSRKEIEWMRRLKEELRRKKLCFSCKEPWEPSHRCMGKGKVHYIEVLSDSDGEEEAGRAQGSEHSNSDDEQIQRMMRNHMWRLRVGLFPLYQVFLDFTLSGSMEYYRDNVSQS
jgi:hypothetical protein